MTLTLGVGGSGACRAFVVAGPSSGAGKTTVALGLMAALRARGLIVQPFKCGPDFIDPGHHTQVCQRESRNIDTWMVGDEISRTTFHQHSAGADVSVVEGVMGLFDGAGASGSGSTAAIARLLAIPVILVVDASGMGASAAAVVNGFATFDAATTVAGVIFNKVAGPSHYEILSTACQRINAVVPLGYIPRDGQLRIAERHLGLLTAQEGAMSPETVAHLGTLVERHVNIDRLLDLSAHLPSSTVREDVARPDAIVRIGVAHDDAFNFYYADNLDALQEAGAELVRFSPLRDGRLPPDLDALYFGGGFPELYAEALSANVAMRSAVNMFVNRSGTVYAECGGLMYLGEGIRARDGAMWPMVGQLPITVAMTDRLQRFGYVELTLTRDCLLGAAGTTARGHSFHYSRIESCSDELECAYQLEYARSGTKESEGYVRSRMLASYIHIHFRSHPELAKTFIREVLKARPSSMVTNR